MLTEIHLLLTYTCNFECDHCFLYCGPRAGGTFTREQVVNVLDQAEELGTINRIYFEGGEPFLAYPLMVEGIRLARDRGFEAGIVTNGYWATSELVAENRLRPLAALGIADLSISDDGYHGEGRDKTPVGIAIDVARRLGLPVNTIAIEEPSVETSDDDDHAKGATIIGGDVVFRGRAADRLTAGLPLSPVEIFTECPFEDLVAPERVHIDTHGNVQFCQGLSIGNLWHSRLADLLSAYRPTAHPICGPLVAGGPARLAECYGVRPESGAVTACHLCFLARRALIGRFPQQLAPRQVYGPDC
jgi:hypothetical protein